MDEDQALEAKVAFERFDVDGSGSVNTEEIKTILSDLGVGADVGQDWQPDSEMPSTEEIDEMIRNADADQTGEVEWSEFLGLWAKIQHYVHLGELKQQFQSFDKDGSGAVGTLELRALLDTIGLHPTDESLARMIRQADNDGTGEIEFPEFVNLWGAVQMEYRQENLVTELRRQSTKYYFSSEQLARMLLEIESEEDRIAVFLVFYARYVNHL